MTNNRMDTAEAQVAAALNSTSSTQYYPVHLVLLRVNDPNWQMSANGSIPCMPG